MMLNLRNKPGQISQSRRSIELLQALNNASAYFQRSAHSETAVFQAYREQMAKLNLRGGLSLLDESGQHLTVRVVNYAGRVGQILIKLENLVDLKTEGHTFAVAAVDVYRQVVAAGQTHYIADSSVVIAQMLPQKAQRYLGRIITIFGASPAIYAPILIAGQVHGVINIVDAQITPGDIPAFTAFANHIAVALENARLFEEIRQHAAALEQRVAERTQELAAANERLTELDRLKSQLISDVSHELRTPITTMELYLDLIKQGNPEKRDHYLAVIANQSHRLKQLVEEILNLSRLEAGRNKLEFMPVELNKVIEQVVVMQKERVEEKGLALHFTPNEHLPKIRGIPSQLSQIVVNLLENSINYTTSGTIQIQTVQEDHDGGVCLVIQDTGRGIRLEDRPYIFDRFYRGHYEGQEKVPGTGLGLAIVKEIVDIHEGKIGFESTPDQGTTFQIWLPALI